MSLSSVLVVLSCLATVTYGAVLDGVDLRGPVRKLHHALTQRLDADSHNLFLGNHMSYPRRWNLGRKLTQHSESTCAWDATVDQCLLSVSKVQDLLEEADNPLANYLNRAITCSTAKTGEDCLAEGCEWHRLFCEVPHDEFRDFVSVECLEDVKHIIEVQAGNLECNPLNTQAACATSSLCTWFNRTGCSFDRWMYFHEIPTIDGAPEGFEEVLTLRARQISEGLNADIRSGVVTSFDGIRDYDPPSFDCPKQYKQVLCDYVDAYTPFLLSQAYCNNAYRSIEFITSCRADPICTPSTRNQFSCDAADEEREKSHIAAEKFFTNNIEDEEARKFLEHVLECAFIDGEDDCEAEEACAWLSRFRICGVSPIWAEKEVYRVVGDSDDVICKFYTTPATTGCIDIEEETECQADRQCVWETIFGTCGAGVYAWLDVALEGEKSEKEYRNAEERCFGDDKDMCGEGDEEETLAEGSLIADAAEQIDMEKELIGDDTDEEGSLTSTTQAIGGSTIVGVFV